MHECDVEHIDWQIGNKSGTIETSLVIQPGEAENIIIPVPELPANQTYPVTIALHSIDEQARAYGGTPYLITITGMKSTAKKAITVDGVLDYLSDVLFIDLADGQIKMQNYGGTADLSGKI